MKFNLLVFISIAATLFCLSENLNAMKRKKEEPEKGAEKTTEKISPKKYKKQIVPEATQQVQTLHDMSKKEIIKSFIEKSFAKIPVDLREELSKESLYYGNTLLHAITNPYDIEPLLKAGSDPNAKNSDNQTVFNYYIAQGKLDAAHLLLELAGEELDVSSPDIFNTTPLMNAIKQGDKILVNKIVELLEKQNKLYAINTLNKAGQTALKLAVLYAPEYITLLVNKGAHVNRTDRIGYTPLWYAVRYKSKSIKPLIDAGALIDIRDNEGSTPLFYAIEYNEESIKPLIEAGANVNVIDATDITPLMLATRLNSNTVPLLLDAGAEINFINNKAFSALTEAISFGNKKSVKILLNNGAVIRNIDLQQASKETVKKAKNKKTIRSSLNSQKIKRKGTTKKIVVPILF